MAHGIAISELIADGITPIAAYRSAGRARPGYSFLFESAPGPERTARYSIVGLGCMAEMRAADGEVQLTARGRTKAYEGSVLDAARSLLASCMHDCREAGGWARFLGAYHAAAFEFAGYAERLPALPRLSDPMPDWHVIIPQTVIVFDHFSHRAAVMTLPGDAGDLRSHDDILAALDGATIAPLAAPDASPAPVPEAPRRPFADAVDRAKEAIAAGEVFQVVLSQRWSAALNGDPFNVYRALRAINPSPYMFYLDFGWGALFGSSPEVLVRLDGDRANLRPLAGTRRRPSDPDDERRASASLRRDPKERAEHVMLVDLGRNDLGRTCVDGSVRVDELLQVERFSHVLHLTSEISGRLRPDCDAFDLFAAAFPAGTVSGAPKIRAMELIAELEGARRGFYAGSVGYFAFDGSMDSCITLRSAHAYDGRAVIAAGAGIVADSCAESEDAECRAKAGAVFEALAAASGSGRT